MQPEFGKTTNTYSHKQKINIKNLARGDCVVAFFKGQSNVPITVKGVVK